MGLGNRYPSLICVVKEMNCIEIEIPHDQVLSRNFLWNLQHNIDTFYEEKSNSVQFMSSIVGKLVLALTKELE